MTDFTQNLLAEWPIELKALFTHKINIYLKTGIDSDFDSQELRNVWFCIKVHELADIVQRHGFNKKLHLQLLKENLEIGAAKFHNPRFAIPKREKCSPNNI